MSLAEPENARHVVASWQAFWGGHSPESEIRMWDFYGGRPWVVKHVPRYGKTLEAGCGLGRYVFLLSELGIDIDGVDSSAECVDVAKSWGAEHRFKALFRQGDVLELPYEVDSLAGYVSLGVIEHFVEGPQRALAEAYRVLRPGGIAVVSTPAVSVSQRYLRARGQAKRAARRLLARPEQPAVFFQHWYSAVQLARFANAAGFAVVLAGTCDLKYAAWELLGGGPTRDSENWLYRLADTLEATPIVRLGAQSFVILVKTSPTMCCFLCGEERVDWPWTAHTYLPVCPSCDMLPVAEYYRTKKAPRFHTKCEYLPSGGCDRRARPCHFCGEMHEQDAVFGQHGFTVPICKDCLAVPVVSIIAANDYLQHQWGARGAGSP